MWLYVKLAWIDRTSRSCGSSKIVASAMPGVGGAGWDEVVWNALGLGSGLRLELGWGSWDRSKRGWAGRDARSDL